jgi:hypothetical protein
VIYDVRSSINKIKVKQKRREKKRREEKRREEKRREEKRRRISIVFPTPPTSRNS